MTQKTSKTDSDWKKSLTPKQYRILREKGTEIPFTGKLLHNKKTGTYNCAACDNNLFSSDTKYDSKSGWPSFHDVINKGNVNLSDDNLLGIKRTEVTCSNCGSHLGHVFNDGPKTLPTGRQATGQRYCINSAALKFQEKS